MVVARGFVGMAPGRGADDKADLRGGAAELHRAFASVFARARRRRRRMGSISAAEVTASYNMVRYEMRWRAEG